MIPAEVTAALDAADLRYCVVGALALAVHGFPRFTADVDLLTTDDRALEEGRWTGVDALIRWGEEDDPIRGLVRCRTRPPVDVIVGRRPAMAFAVATAELEPALGALVATPVAFTLLKLEAGSPHDIADASRVLEAQRHIRGDDSLVGELAAHAELLSPWGRRAYERLLRDLAQPTRPPFRAPP
ncbi:MAG: hypothetical protein KC635_28575 [Myxococcales bacterium]|nr:hypothetical protein [Myxococcales bacterium]MCB9732162.1 hypothetical protein [Deltaproteobacteria bacterium]